MIMLHNTVAPILMEDLSVAGFEETKGHGQNATLPGTTGDF